MSTIGEGILHLKSLLCLNLFDVFPLAPQEVITPKPYSNLSELSRRRHPLHLHLPPSFHPPPTFPRPDLALRATAGGESLGHLPSRGALDLAPPGEGGFW